MKVGVLEVAVLQTGRGGDAEPDLVAVLVVVVILVALAYWFLRRGSK